MDDVLEERDMHIYLVLGMLCKDIQSPDCEAELAAVCELADACPKVH